MKSASLVLLVLLPVMAYASVTVESKRPAEFSGLSGSAGVAVLPGVGKPSPGVPVVLGPRQGATPPMDKDAPRYPTILPSVLREVSGVSDLYAKEGWEEGAQACTYTGMASGRATTVTGSPEFFIVNQSSAYWTAVGIRSLPGDDWDLAMYKTLGADPACVDSLLAFSNVVSGVDVVAMDFNYQTPGVRYPQATRYSGTGDAVIEWDSGPDVLYPNGGAAFRTTGPDDVLEIWDSYLEAGLEYGILLSWSGSADLRVLLFENPAAAPYTVGRLNAAVDSTYFMQVIPGVTGWHGLVVVNENGGNADYTIEIGTCTTPIPLVSGVSQPLVHGQHHFSFEQTASYWTALAVRSDTPGPEWATFSYGTGSGEVWPNCLSNPLNAAHGVGYEGRWINFGFLDFNAGGQATGTYYDWAGPYEPDGSTARLEWDSGADALSVGAAPVYRTIDATDVVEIWDVYLYEGRPYTALVSMTGTAAPLATAVWWDDTYQQNLVLAFGLPTPGSGICESFVARKTDWHGFAVMNFNGGGGTYGVSLVETFQDVADTLLQNAEDGRGCSWVDFDGDGDLDLHQMNSHAPNRMFTNDGLGNFTDGTAPILPFSFGLDLYCVSGHENVLLRNEGGGVFVDVTSPPLNDSGDGNQAAAGDYDNDGDLDLYLANGDALTSPLTPNRLFRNEGLMTFVDVTPLGLRDSTSTRGAMWTDFDNDGNLDLLTVGALVPNRLFGNYGGSLYEVRPSAFDDTRFTPGASVGDADGDGDVDFYFSNGSAGGFPENQFVRNDLCNGNAWARIKLDGVVSNRDGIGAKVFLHTAGGYQTTRWDMTVGGVGLGGSPLPVHLGLGYATTIDSVVVLWPGGIRQTLIAPAPYQTLVIVEDTSSLVGMPGGGESSPGPLLHASVRNPFSRATAIRFELPRQGPAALRVFDSRGRLVRTLMDEEALEAGPHDSAWDGRSEAGTRVAAGVYFYRLETEGGNQARKLVLLN